MTIYIAPLEYRTGLKVPVSRLISDTPGEKGYEELVQFANDSVMLFGSFQKEGEYFPGIEVWGNNRLKAIKAGAVEVDKLVFMKIVNRNQERAVEVAQKC